MFCCKKRPSKQQDFFLHFHLLWWTLPWTGVKTVKLQQLHSWIKDEYVYIEMEQWMFWLMFCSVFKEGNMLPFEKHRLRENTFFGTEESIHVSVAFFFLSYFLLLQINVLTEESFWWDTWTQVSVTHFLCGQVFPGYDMFHRSMQKYVCEAGFFVLFLFVFTVCGSKCTNFNSVW